MKQVQMTEQRKISYHYQESIKTLRTNLLFAGRGVKKILFTSCVPNEGKTDVSFQLAKEFGELGKKVLFLDADIRKSALVSKYLVQEEVVGLSKYLSGHANLSDIIYSTNFEGVYVIFAGHSAPNPSELLADTLFNDLLNFAAGQFDYIIIDAPPIINMTDAAVIASVCDGSVLVIESGAVSYKLEQKAMDQLKKANCRVLGAVLNKVDHESSRYYDKYYYKYYGEESQNHEKQ